MCLQLILLSLFLFLGVLTNNLRSTSPSMNIWNTMGAVDMPLEQVQMDYVTKTTPLERRFSPYDFNGG
jgi:hypothetical protein